MNEGPSIEHSLMVVSTAPDRIWLDLGFDPSDEDEVSFHELIDVTWSHDNASGYGVEYVRVDTTQPQRTWVGLTLEDMQDLNVSKDWIDGARWAATLLWEKNND